VIGLSGLITPSLDEMVHVAQEMEREGFKLPLLIGGATTSRAHTAVKIAPHYQSSTVHVLDASRAVGVVNALLNDRQRGAFDTKTRAEYASLREQYAAKTRDKKILKLEEARARRTPIDWSSYIPPKPGSLGPHVYSSDPGTTPVSGVGEGVSPSQSSTAVSGQDTASITREANASRSVSIKTLIDYIDWSPFFHTWELRGRYPAIFDDPTVGTQARELFDDAQELLKQIVAQGSLTARGVYALWPANARGDDVDLYKDETRREKLATFYFLRQQMPKPDGQWNHSLADFIAPISDPQSAVGNQQSEDYLGGFAVTIHGADELAKKFSAEHDDYNAILSKALADRLAEAFAEYLHKEARLAWSFGRDEKLSEAELIAEKYQGIRPAAGYPACPDHAEKQTLFDLLNAEANTGIKLTESFAMHPGASVSGLYFSHPESKYFGVGQIGRDQVTDYANRKGETIAVIEKRLGPNLAYEV
jgi:5-methyltetrahydrofolate--homocysteine methyltransferase